MNRNLWALLCYLAYDSVATMEAKTDKKELWKLVNVHFTTLYTQTLSEKAYFVDNLLSFMPNNTLPGETHPPQ